MKKVQRLMVKAQLINPLRVDPQHKSCLGQFRSVESLGAESVDERLRPDPELRHTAGQTLGLATEVPAPIFLQNWEDFSMQQTMVPWRSS
jgi:hypothetical protein